MKSEEILSSIGETIEYGRLYVEQQKDYFRLEMAEGFAKATSELVTVAVIAFFAALVLIFLSIAGGLFLGAVLNSYALGFLIITGIYSLISALIFFNKKSLITNPILTMIIKALPD